MCLDGARRGEDARLWVRVGVGGLGTCAAAVFGRHSGHVVLGDRTLHITRSFSAVLCDLDGPLTPVSLSPHL